MQILLQHLNDDFGKQLLETRYLLIKVKFYFQDYIYGHIILVNIYSHIYKM